MAFVSSNSEVAKEFRFFRVYKDGRVEFFWPHCKKIPPSDDPTTGVRSKDVVISSEPHVSARIFLPKLANPNQRLPLVFYLHGGGFSTLSAFAKSYHNFCNIFSSEANALVVSVEYGLFPDRPIPACYEDSWAALKWVASHAGGNGPEPWLNDYADYGKVFISGDSAGGNISHTLAFRVGSIGLPGVKVVGLMLVHPFFGGVRDEDEMWLHMCPNNRGLQDPRIRPPADNLVRVCCERILVILAEKDFLRGPGKRYCEDLERSGWGGSLEIVEHKGVGHVFHLSKPNSQQALDLIRRLISFINQDNVKCVSKI